MLRDWRRATHWIDSMDTLQREQMALVYPKNPPAMDGPTPSRADRPLSVTAVPAPRGILIGHRSP